MTSLFRSPLRARSVFGGAAGIVLVLAAAALAASASASASASGAAAQACKSQADAARPESQALPRVAFVYKDDQQGADAASHERARTALAQAFAGRACLLAFDRLSEGVDPDANARFLLGTLAMKRYALIIVTTPDYADMLARVAAQFPDTRFLHMNGEPGAANVGTYRLRRSEGAYLAGIAAAGASRSGRLGILIRDRTLEEVAVAKAFQRGARAANPSASVRVELAPSNDDLAGYGAAVERLVRREADVLFQAGESPALMRLARAEGAGAIAWGDQAASQPPSRVATVQVDWAGVYEAEIAHVLDHTATASNAMSYGVAEGAIRLEHGSGLSATARRVLEEQERSFRKQEGQPREFHLDQGRPVQAASEVDRLHGYRDIDWSRLSTPGASFDDERVRISGFVIPLAASDQRPTRFLLVPTYRDADHPARQPGPLLLVEANSPRAELGAMSGVSVRGVLKARTSQTAAGACEYTLIADFVVPYAYPEQHHVGH